MIKRQWVFRDVDRQGQMMLAQMLDVSPITASILLGRGVTTSEQAAAWWRPGSTRRDPLGLPDMAKAVDRLHTAVRTGERICFYGDYDVDGITATSIYVQFFRTLGADVRWYIPHRVAEGYGLNAAAVGRIAADGVRVLVTSDCGTTSCREIEEAGRLGMDVIVTDHHQCGTAIAPALAVINPMRPDAAYPFTGLCSAGLAYKVVQAYRARFGDAGPDPDSFLDLVALATVADIVPLQDENRHYVQIGLGLISRGARCGIRALKQAAGIDRPCTAGTVAFRLAPRINAAGRLAHADAAVRLLITEDEREATELAGQLDTWNKQRQQIEEDITSQAVGAVTDADPPAALVLASRHWHLGVVGIVAARLVERWHRPAVVIAINEQGIGKGSARSVPGFDLYQALGACADLLEAYGGHPAAAGLTVREACLPAFTERFRGVAAAWSGQRPPVPVLHVDTEVSLVDVVPRLIQELDRLHPFGAGNPEPTLAIRNVTIMDARVVGENHLKLIVRQGRSVPFESIGFRMGALERHGLSRVQPVDLAFMPELNRWNGMDRVQLRLRDVRATLPA